MWCWRRMLRISWIKRLTNEKVLEMAGQKRILMDTIKKGQLGFVGYIIRENGLERLCLEGKFEGRRARGRQRLTYLVSLAEKVGLKIHQLIHCAGDRRAFRALAAKASI